MTNEKLKEIIDSLLYVVSWLESEYENGEGKIPDGLYNAARISIKKATGITENE